MRACLVVSQWSLSVSGKVNWLCRSKRQTGQSYISRHQVVNYLDSCSEIKGLSSHPFLVSLPVHSDWLQSSCVKWWWSYDLSSDAFHLLLFLVWRSSFQKLVDLGVAKTVPTVRSKLTYETGGLPPGLDQIILYGDQPKTGSYIAHVWSNKLVSSKTGGV